jgi:nicotinamidase/pyrazinamidase
MPESALIMIDVQNDFCPAYVSRSGEKRPAGALAVENGDEVITPLNALSREFALKGLPVIATADWHPLGHISFGSSHAGKKSGDLHEGQLLWPDHCVQGKSGAEFHEKLDTKPVTLIIRKGFRSSLDSYSAFFENDRKTSTGLAGFLKELGTDTVFLGGLATDYCVLYSALDAAALGLKTAVIIDAVRGVGFPEGSVERAFDTMKKAGISLVTSEEVQHGN